MLRRQSWIALGVAVILGLFAVYIANSYLLGSQKQRRRWPAPPRSPWPPRRWRTEPTSRRTRSASSIIPTASIPPGAFTNAAQLMPAGKRRVALMPIGVNEPILATKISGEGQGASIAALLPDGMRAASVRINDVSGVAGFVQPNDSVDVLITRQIPGESAGNASSPTSCSRTSA